MGGPPGSEGKRFRAKDSDYDAEDDPAVQRLDARLRPLAAALLAGTLSRAEFIQQATAALHNGIASGARGEGATADDAASIADQLIAERESYLADYADALDAADEDTGSGLLGRVALWAGLAWAGAMAGRVAGGDDDTLYDWVLDRGAQHCDDCVDLAENGPYAAEDLPSYPGDGSTQCNGNCRCELRETSGSKAMTGVLKFAGDVQVKDGVITAVLSTEAVDRDGDVVRLSGWDLTNFNRAPRLMSCHDYGSLTKQIGEWRNVHVDRAIGALVGEPHYYTGQGNPEADWGYYLASIGQATYSVGFNPTEWEPRKGSRGGSEFTAQELLECSHVPIPANQEAVQLMAKAFQLRHRQATPFATGPQASPRKGRTVQKDMAGDEQTCVQMAQDILDRLNQLILHESQEQVAGSDEDDDIRLLLTCRDMIQQFQRNEMLGDTGDYGYGYAYMAGMASHFKAGRAISAANMNQLHTAMDAMHAVHDGACKDDACDYNSGDDGDEAKRSKAMGEGDGSAGGVTVSDSGTHAPMTGSHSHPHTSSGDQGGDALHEHEHSHDGDASHASADHKSDHKNYVVPLVRAERSTESTNDLPDSAFAVISAGGEKDADGKTTPRSLRHLPHHHADGSIDLPHLKSYVEKNALARVSQTDLSAEDRAKAEKHLENHAKDEKIGDYAEKEETQGLDPQAFRTAVEKQLTEALEAVEW